MDTRTVVATHDLSGQPESIDISPNGRHAAVAIENQRVVDNDGANDAPGESMFCRLGAIR